MVIRETQILMSRQDTPWKTTCPSSSFTPSSAFTIMLTLNRDPQSDFSLNRSYFYH